MQGTLTRPFQVMVWQRVPRGIGLEHRAGRGGKSGANAGRSNRRCTRGSGWGQCKDSAVYRCGSERATIPDRCESSSHAPVRACGFESKLRILAPLFPARAGVVRWRWAWSVARPAVRSSQCVRAAVCSPLRLRRVPASSQSGLYSVAAVAAGGRGEQWCDMHATLAPPASCDLQRTVCSPLSLLPRLPLRHWSEEERRRHGTAQCARKRASVGGPAIPLVHAPPQVCRAYCVPFSPMPAAAWSAESPSHASTPRVLSSRCCLWSTESNSIHLSFHLPRTSVHSESIPSR